MDHWDELKDLLNGPASRFSFSVLRSLLDTWPDKTSLEGALKLASARLRTWPSWTRNLTASPQKLAAFVGTPGWQLTRWLHTNLYEEEDGESTLASIISHPFSHRIRGLNLTILGQSVADQLKPSTNFTGLRHLKLTTLDDNSTQAVLHTIRDELPPGLTSLHIRTPPEDMPAAFVDFATNNEWQPKLRCLSLNGLDPNEEIRFAESCRRPIQSIHPTPETLPIFLNNAILSRELRHITLHGLGFGDSAIKLLSKCKHSPNIDSLNLYGTRTSPAGVSSLSEARFTSRLKQLTIVGVPLFDEGWAAIGSLPLDSLRSLWIPHTGGTPFGARSLAHSTQIANLTSLNISNNLLGDKGLHSIVNWKQTDRLVCLRANHSGKSAAAAAALASRPRPRLRHLHFGGDDIGDEGVEEFARCTTAWALTTLNLLGSKIGDHGAQMLASSGRFPRLRRLLLSSNNITSTGARAIAHSTMAVHINDLSLHHNQLKDDGAIALAESQRLTNLVFLDVVGNDISVNGSKALSLSPLAKRLEGVKVEVAPDFIAPWQKNESIRPACRADPTAFRSH